MPSLLPLPQDCTVFETENKILHVVSPAPARPAADIFKSSPIISAVPLISSSICNLCLFNRGFFCVVFYLLLLRLLLRLHLCSPFIAGRVIFASLSLL